MEIIRFRVWDPEKKKMIYNIQSLIFAHHGLVVEYNTDLNAGIKIYGGIVTQFTGLLDKNGKEIYNGDIILHDYLRDEKTRSVVEWHFNGWYANSLEDPSKQVTGFGNLFNCKNIEILGNIYENPELLIK
jgi:uncharacterized phage protein (TIGR01671 family)